MQVVRVYFATPLAGNIIREHKLVHRN